VPTEESCKLTALFEKLDETGILDGSGGKTLIFSQFREMVELVNSMLEKKGVSTAIISGKTNQPGYRRAVMDRFQEGDLSVVCIVTTAGGVSLTLDAADSAHFIDETWAPDDQEQAEDRIHRGSRMHETTIYHYRGIDTIDETIAIESADKDRQHKFLLDERRKIIAKHRKLSTR
jgi:SNF2 family DNA or RNA helicase